VPPNVAPEVDIIQRARLLAQVPVQAASEHANASALAALVSAWFVASNRTFFQTARASLEVLAIGSRYAFVVVGDTIAAACDTPSVRHFWRCACPVLIGTATYKHRGAAQEGKNEETREKP